MEDFKNMKVFILEPIDELEYTFKQLEEMGCTVILGPPVSKTDKKFTEEELIKKCQDVDVIMGMAREKITKKVIEASKKLRVICKYGNGVDNINVKAATEKGVLVANAPVHNMTVAEYAFSLILCFLKRIIWNEKYLKSGGWRDQTTMGNELYKKIVGIVGLGAIGKELAKRLNNWDVKIIAYDPYVKDNEAEKINVELVDWEYLFKNSDIISLHLPLNSKTEGIVSKDEFCMMKSSSIIINTSRGKIINERDLVSALKSNVIRGAALDVFEEEPLKIGSPLLDMGNVILTPHNAGYTAESLERIAIQSTKNCIQALSGKKPDYIVNASAFPLWGKRFANKN